LALTSCSKQVDEPSVNIPEQNSTIHLNIEGEREDIPMVDASGRAINLTGNVVNKKITSITLEFSEQVDGIVCIYNKEGKGFTRQVKFDVNGRKFVFKGNINLNGASKELLREHAEGLKTLTQLLLDREVIYTEDVEHIFGKRAWVSRTEELILANEEAKSPSTEQSPDEAPSPTTPTTEAEVNTQ